MNFYDFVYSFFSQKSYLSKQIYFKVIRYIRMQFTAIHLIKDSVRLNRVVEVLEDKLKKDGWNVKKDFTNIEEAYFQEYLDDPITQSNTLIVKENK